MDLCPFEKLRSVLDGLEAQITDLRGKFLEKEAPGECSTPERNAKWKVRNDEPGQRSKNRKVDMGTCRAEVQEEKERGRDATDGARDIGRSAIQLANGEDMPEAPPEEVISGPFFSCCSNKAHSNRLDFTIIKTLEMVDYCVTMYVGVRMQNHGLPKRTLLHRPLPLCTLEWSRSWTYRSASSVQQMSSNSFVQQKINCK